MTHFFFSFLSRHWKCFWMALVIEFSWHEKFLWQLWPSTCWLNGQEKFIPRYERTNFPCPLNQWLLSAAPLSWSQASRKSQICSSLKSFGMWEGLLFSNGGPRSATPARLLEMQILRSRPRPSRSETVFQQALWEIVLHVQGWEPLS